MVARVLTLAGEQRSAVELEQLDTWSRYQQVIDLYLAASKLTGDVRIGRRCGERLMQEYSGTGVDAVLRSLGSPGEVLRNVAAAAAKFSTVIRMEAIEVGETYAVIGSGNRPGVDLPKIVCEYTQGVVSQAAQLFGMDPADVIERQCQAEGADRCIYDVTWDPTSARDNLQRRIDHLEGELSDITSRFEALMSTASCLVSASDVEELLGVIVERAADTVRAPQHLLAVRLSKTGRLRVHQRGFDNADTAAAVAEILAPTPDDSGGSRLIVDVASRARRYGRLAALYPEGACFLPAERRLLQAFAGHAAAALEAAAARQEAEHRNTTARALLALATSLAQVGTQHEIATRLADAVSRVVDCDSACVLLWDAADEKLHLEAGVGVATETEAQLRAKALSDADLPGLADMIRSPQPVFLRDAQMSPELRALLRTNGTASIAVVPITNRAEFFGVITAKNDDARRLRDDEHLLERLSGMADHAATALLNARLLDQIRHQVLHDGLTGLPNRILLKDRAERAAAQARQTSTHVALIFVDLDGFKAVNDALGHSTGDKLLIEVAQRLQSLARDSDTVARLGGDEFALLLPDAADNRAIEAFTRRIATEIKRPYCINHQYVTVSASLGISTIEPDDDYEAFLHRADLAMYKAKSDKAA
jgi:diguanylate cyclase (GGDEF)-like protein